MFYILLKFLGRQALKLYCREIYTCNSAILRQRGPFLLAANHPNAFLDAVMIASHCRRKTFILVRGDAFKSPWASMALRLLYCIPIYRQSEGRGLKDRTERTFKNCLHLLEKGYNVLIFSEGICENEWTLRPLGKGTARLAFLGWQQPAINSSFQVIPIGITYQNFNRIGKKVFFMVGEPIAASQFNTDLPVKVLSDFNNHLEERLCDLTIQVPKGADHISRFQSWMEDFNPGTTANLKDRFLKLQEAMFHLTWDHRSPGSGDSTEKKRTSWPLKQLLLTPLALAGWLLHAPLYYGARSITRKKTAGTVYFDSVLFGSLFIFYPIYVVLVTGILYWIIRSWGCLLLAVLAPLLAYVTLCHPVFYKDR